MDKNKFNHLLTNYMPKNIPEHVKEMVSNVVLVSAERNGVRIHGSNTLEDFHEHLIAGNLRLYSITREKTEVIERRLCDLKNVYIGFVSRNWIN